MKLFADFYEFVVDWNEMHMPTFLLTVVTKLSHPNSSLSRHGHKNNAWEYMNTVAKYGMYEVMSLSSDSAEFKMLRK